MAVGDWTFSFDGTAATFVWLEQGSPPITPSFKQPPVTSIRKLIGSRESKIVQLGFDTNRIRGRIRVEDSTNAANLNALNGYFGELSDGTSTWDAYLELDLDPIVSGVGGWEGTATFTRTEGP